MRKLFIGGNWKCNPSLPDCSTLVTTLLDKLQFDPAKVGTINFILDVIVAPIFIHLGTVLSTKKLEHVQVAAQNCSMYGLGAFTGEVSAQQLKQYNVHWVIIGHSQRRTHFGQTDEIVSKKLQAALKSHLKVIFCFGQTNQQRQANHTVAVVKRQLDAIKTVVDNWDNIVLAYEPVWAIGTGKTATTGQVDEIHSWIRQYLRQISEQAANTRVIYGGSVTQKNCQQLIKVKDVDGFLVGGASLKPAFLEIVHSAGLK